VLDHFALVPVVNDRGGVAMVRVHWNQHEYFRLVHYSSDYYVLGHLCIGMIIRSQLHLDHIGVVITEVRELHLELAVVAHGYFTLLALVTDHMGGHGYVLQGRHELAVNGLADYLSHFAPGQMLEDRYIKDLSLPCTSQLLVLAQGYADELA